MKRMLIPQMLCLALPAFTFQFSSLPVTRISVDATDATRRLYHVKMTMPVKPGPLTLLYPQWIPGEHGPTGPVTDLVNIRITSNGQAIPWRRELADMYAFHASIPDGVTSIDIALEYIAAPESSGFTSGGSTTDKLAVLNWNQMLLYPKGTPSDQLNYQADLKVPRGLALRHRPAYRERERSEYPVQAQFPDHADRFARLDGLLL
jgi:predicted metalloprotease with PDZ domain